MAASLGTLTYASTIWTNGDYIAEAKLDNMVNNDQAYDSHAAQGILLNNNISFAGKNAAGSTNMNIAKFDTSDNMQIGENNVGGHTVINAGTSKLVKIKALRQDNTSNSYEANDVFLTGWDYVTVSSTDSGFKDITFGITFSSRPIVVLNGSSVSSSTPTHVGSASSGPDNEALRWTVNPRNIATTGFTMGWRSNGNFPASRFLSFTWIAIGPL